MAAGAGLEQCAEAAEAKRLYQLLNRWRETRVGNVLPTQPNRLARTAGARRWCITAWTTCASPAKTPLGAIPVKSPLAEAAKSPLGANPVTTPLGEPSKITAWRAQQNRRLASPAKSPLGEPSKIAAWRRVQYLPRLAAKPVITPLDGEPINHAAWREASVYLAWRPMRFRRGGRGGCG